ncbi:MAG: lysozyme inhibitor LprI family protein [Pseudomonadota bacterium]
MHLKDLIPALLVAIVAHASAADDSPFTCKPDGNQQEMNTCAARDYRAADAALNIKYGEVMASLPVTGQANLRREQRAWLKQRDPQCKAKARQFEGGSIWPLQYFSCLQASTEKRTKELGRP